MERRFGTGGPPFQLFAECRLAGHSDALGEASGRGRQPMWVAVHEGVDASHPSLVGRHPRGSIVVLPEPGDLAVAQGEDHHPLGLADTQGVSPWPKTQAKSRRTVWTFSRSLSRPLAVTVDYFDILALAEFE